MKASKLIVIVREILKGQKLEKGFNRELVRELIATKASQVAESGENLEAFRQITQDIISNIENMTDEEIEDATKTMSNYLEEENYFASIIRATISLISKNKSGDPDKMFG